MKNRTNKILLLAFIITVFLSFFIDLLWLEIITIEVELPNGILGWLGLYFPVVPFFLLQFLLCRGSKKRWVKFVPLVCIFGIVLSGAINYSNASGWDTLGWLLILILCIAPVVGCVLAFVVYYVSRCFFERRKSELQEKQ